MEKTPQRTRIGVKTVLSRISCYTSLSSFAVIVCLFVSLVSGCAAEPVNENSVVPDLTAAGDEGDVNPIWLCSPQYPRRAAIEGIEGFVEMMFDIDDSGTPINIEVTKSQPSGVFDAVALKSMECSKFKVKDERGRVTFTIEFKI